MISNMIMGLQREEEVNMVLNVHRTVRLIRDRMQEKVSFTILYVSRVQARSRGGR